MRFLSKYILIAASLLIPALLTGCKDDAIEEDVKQFPDITERDAPRIVLEITPISSSGIDLGVKEMVKSLRIILLTETKVDGVTKEYVEFNQYIDFENPDQSTYPGTSPGGSLIQPANTFKYYFTRATVPGIKKFFLIANEKEVDDIHFDTKDDTLLPEGYGEEPLDLHNFLKSIQADYVPNLIYDLEHQGEEHPEPIGERVEKQLNCIYYKPVFKTVKKVMTIDEGDGAGDGDGNGEGGTEGEGGNENPGAPEQQYQEQIFLPYTTQYVYNLVTKNEAEGAAGNNVRVHVVDETMYLIPCANKVRFKFRNYRASDLIIKELKLSGIATQMYLFGQVNQQEMTLSTKKLWWVNWLASVSTLSHNPEYAGAPENEVFNQTYGWIDDFKVPTEAYKYAVEETINFQERKGVLQFVGTNYWVIDQREPGVPVNQAAPGTAETGYFYLPESRNLIKLPVTDENNQIIPDKFREVQAYYLTMKMHDNIAGVPDVVKDTQIGNVGSLFRNKDILITVTLRDGDDVGAYAEPVRWSDRHSYGYVIEEETP